MKCFLIPPPPPLGSLKASRRRPVSVDTDIRSNHHANRLSGNSGAMGGAATLGAGGLVGAAAAMGASRGHVVPPGAGGAGDGGVGVRDRDGGRGLPYDAMIDHSSAQASGGYGNRNSHPFTEREVEQGFQKMDGEIVQHETLGHGTGWSVL